MTSTTAARLPYGHHPGHPRPTLCLQRLVVALVCAASFPLAVAAQGLPSTPITTLDGRLAVEGTLAVSLGTPDDRSYYNLAGYETDLLRATRLDLDLTWLVSSRVAVIADVYALTPSTRWHWHAYASTLALRVQPLDGRALTLSAGIVTPAFGTFLHRRYGLDNPLIGYPVSYHYATSVRPDAVPASVDELLRRRGRGAVAQYSVGAAGRDSGLPLVSALGWNPGVGLSAGRGPFRAEVTVTKGGIANREGGGWQASGRMQVKSGPGLVAGLSMAHGSYLDDSLESLLGSAARNRRPRETALGLDAEYSRGYWILRAEATWNRRTLPAFNRPLLDSALKAFGADVEVRYRLRPGLYVAARGSRLVFSRLQGTTGSTSWDANVGRVEAGAGYSFARNLTLKVTHQYSTRDTSQWFPSRHATAAQVVAWF